MVTLSIKTLDPFLKVVCVMEGIAVMSHFSFNTITQISMVIM